MSNVPFVVVALPWVKAMPDPRWGFIVLAMASTLAGNLTLLGSVANLIVFESAGAHGTIRFGRFLRYGALLTFATLAVAMGLLLLQKSLGI